MNDRLRTALAGLDHVEEGDSAFTDTVAFWVNGTEVAHFEGDSAIDIRLTRGLIRQRRAGLRADSRVVLRRGTSDWLTVTVADPADEDFVVELVRAAAAAHLPPPGTSAVPPPSGRDLARRRRFH